MGTILTIVILRFKYRAIIIFVISFLASMMAFRPVLEISKNRNLTDCPGVRKVQRHPIPVMGGIVVFFGIIVGLSFFKTMHVYTSLFPVVCAMTIMLFVGCVDDLLEIAPMKRMVLEVLVAVLVVMGSGFHINNFQGLWGIDVLSQAVSVPLTVLTFVGIVNAMNMIDGVDGLSSAFGIMILTCFATVFFLAHEFSMCALAIVSTASLVPFFLHNVFGKYTKMFIGDGGAMMVGSIIAVMVASVLDNRMVFELWPSLDFSRIAFVVAVLSIPVADTLRVMFVRIFNHKSPFYPDKKHLHHYLLGLGFSHFAITLIEVTLNAIVMAAFIVSWLMGATVAWQLYIVVIIAALLDFGIPAAICLMEKHNPSGLDKVKSFALKTSSERKGIRLRIQKLIDGKKYYQE